MSLLLKFSFASASLKPKELLQDAIPRHRPIQAALVAEVLHYQVSGQSLVLPPIDSTVSFTFTQLAGRFGLITLIVIIVFVWTIIRVAQFVNRLWRGTDATSSARIGVAAAA
jgi:hypothetical protein